MGTLMVAFKILGGILISWLAYLILEVVVAYVTILLFGNQAWDSFRRTGILVLADIPILFFVFRWLFRRKTIPPKPA